ncbi:MAG TPA: S24/S26 family peptidase [Burkholderiales bacterium]|nr:S24/S26 family peptidase [Burkholderiales bacterium]
MSLLKEDFMVLLAIVLILLLSGCDFDDYERHVRAAEFKTRFMNGCMPRKGDIVTARWERGELICKRITPTGRYGKSFPHAEIRVAHISEVEQ